MPRKNREKKPKGAIFTTVGLDILPRSMRDFPFRRSVFMTKHKRVFTDNIHTALLNRRASDKLAEFIVSQAELAEMGGTDPKTLTLGIRSIRKPVLTVVNNTGGCTDLSTLNLAAAELLKLHAKSSDRLPKMPIRAPLDPEHAKMFARKAPGRVAFRPQQKIKETMLPHTEFRKGESVIAESSVPPFDKSGARLLGFVHSQPKRSGPNIKATHILDKDGNAEPIEPITIASGSGRLKNIALAGEGMIRMKEEEKEEKKD